tara:strand:- start:3052 stop:3297 length:246 start_codon:yes stop_codon:yes gene_type:complete
MKPIKRLQLGKNKLSKTFITQIKLIFKNEEVLKISILKSACRDKKEAEKIADKIIKELGKNYNYKLIGYVITIRKFRKFQR